MKDSHISSKNRSTGIVQLIGIPSDENSSYLKGCALGPPKIREALHCGAANLYSELGIDIGDESALRDLGDLEIESGQAGFDQIETHITERLQEGGPILSLGGDHAVTYPIIRGFSRYYPELTILQFDAHSDTYEDFEGNPLSHASPFARIMEEKLASRLIQVGIRTLTDHIRVQNTRYGIEVIEAQHFLPDLELNLSGPLYISFDLDVLEPGLAPGVSHYEPGGLTVRNLIDMIHRIQAPVVGADIVEYNPTRDVSDLTAMVAAKLLKELAAKMINSPL